MPIKYLLQINHKFVLKQYCIRTTLPLLKKKAISLKWDAYAYSCLHKWPNLGWVVDMEAWHRFIGGGDRRVCSRVWCCVIILCILLWLYESFYFLFFESLSLLFSRPSSVPTAGSSPALTSPDSEMSWGQWSSEEMAQLEAKKLVESQPETDTPWKEGGSKEATQKPQAEWKGEKGHFPSSRGYGQMWAGSGCWARGLLPLLPKCNFVLVSLSASTPMRSLSPWHWHLLVALW